MRCFTEIVNKVELVFISRTFLHDLHNANTHFVSHPVVSLVFITQQSYVVQKDSRRKQKTMSLFVPRNQIPKQKKINAHDV